MSYEQSAIRDWLEWVAAASGLGLMKRLGPRFGLGTLRLAGRAACAIAVGRRRRARLNVARALELDADDPEVRRIVRRSFESLALNALEATYLARALQTRPVEDFMAIDGLEHLEAAIASGRGLILATGHLGAWEAPGPVLSPRIANVWAVGRALDNPRLSGLAEASRSKWARGMIDKDGGGRQILRVIKEGGAVYMLLDQNAGQKGVILDFLGRPSLHHRVAGTMAVRYGALVVPLYMLREPGVLRYRFVVEEPLAADPSLSGEEAETDVVRRLSRSLEARVRESPDQWNWLHDRWRRAERFLVEGPVEHPLVKPAKKGLLRRLVKGTKA